MASPTGPTTNVKWLPKYDDTEQRLSVKATAALTTGLGLGGADVVSDTSPQQGNWLVIHALTDVVFASVARRNSTGSLAGVTLKAGDRIYGEFTSVTLTSGTAELYKSTL